MQIAFVTLFLGLTLGAYPVEVSVEGPVAAVELLLDGASVGRIAGPPWTGQVDFGTALQPHELVARALDSQGQEVARARQWVNLPRPEAEVEIVLEGGAEGRPDAARLTWQSRTGANPLSVRLTLDDKPLAVGPDGRAALPAYNPEVSHVLSAEVRFPSSVVARKDAVFGGQYGAQISFDLTAVPVQVERGRLPEPAAMRGWLLSGGQPLTVAAVDQDPAEVVVVHDLGAAGALAELGKVRPRRTKDGRGTLAIERDYLRFEIGLRKDDEVRFLWPVPRTFSGAGLPAELFDQSRAFTLQDGGLHWLLTRVLPAREAPGKQRLADAIAVAGLQAMASSRPRAVVLVLGSQPEDASRYDPATVRRYLESIRVPLFVWTVEKGAAESPALAGWGKVEDASNLNRFRSAVARLRDTLEAQRVVWVEGTHLPQSISLAPAAAGIGLF